MVIIMVTPERIKQFLDKQYLACNQSTLLSLYEACKNMSVIETKSFLKNFHQSQLDKYGKALLLDFWSVQEDESALNVSQERTGDIELLGKGEAHVSMPNSIRYGPEHLKNKYLK